MVEVLFRGYFLEGKDLTQPAALIELAQRAGIDAQRARICLDDDAATANGGRAGRRGPQMGVAGVPFFIFGGQLAVSGAQEPEVLAARSSRPPQSWSSDGFAQRLRQVFSASGIRLLPRHISCFTLGVLFPISINSLNARSAGTGQGDRSSQLARYV